MKVGRSVRRVSLYVVETGVRRDRRILDFSPQYEGHITVGSQSICNNLDLSD